LPKLSRATGTEMEVNSGNGSWKKDPCWDESLYALEFIPKALL
jgi:hypothetical protein